MVQKVELKEEDELKHATKSFDSNITTILIIELEYQQLLILSQFFGLVI